MSVYDVYIVTKNCPHPIIRKASSRNPDEAIHKLRTAGEYVPETGDRVIRCVEVDRPQGGRK